MHRTHATSTLQFAVAFALQGLRCERGDHPLACTRFNGIWTLLTGTTVLHLELAPINAQPHLIKNPLLKHEPFLSVCEPIYTEDKIYEPISDWFIKLVHKCEPFFHLLIFSKKKVHKLCPKTSVVTSGFVNQFLGTLLFVLSFLTKGS